MFLYWSIWTGSGTTFDPFRTVAQDAGAVGSAIDLRTDPTSSAGKAIVGSSVQLPNVPTGVLFLIDTATQLDTLVPTNVRNQINRDLGVTISTGLTYRQALRELMTQHGNDRWGVISGSELFFGFAGSISLGG